MAQNYGLGRGLSSLIPQKKINNDDSDISSKEDSQEKEPKKRHTTSFGFPYLGDTKTAFSKKEEIGKSDKMVLEADINDIITNPYQPRIDFDKEKLSELANSLKNHGIIQPLLVSRKGEKFELVAGERRLQAAKLAGITKVPVIVKAVENKEKLELAIIENVQRHNLNPIEEAKAYHKLIMEFKMNQEEVADKMGKSRSSVANKIRLLGLSIDAVRALNEGKITEGHAKIILSLEDKEKQKILLDMILEKQLTVRQAENKINEISNSLRKRKAIVDPEIRDLEEKFSSALGTRVKVKRMGKEGGRIMIDYYSKEELNGIARKIEI